MNKKQSIETVPKDGQFVLLYGGEFYSRSQDNLFTEAIPCVVGKFVSEGEYRYTSYDGGHYGYYYNATHWAPLPKGDK